MSAWGRSRKRGTRRSSRASTALPSRARKSARSASRISRAPPSRSPSRSPARAPAARPRCPARAPPRALPAPAGRPPLRGCRSPGGHRPPGPTTPAACRWPPVGAGLRRSGPGGLRFPRLRCPVLRRARLPRPAFPAFSAFSASADASICSTAASSCSRSNGLARAEIPWRSIIGACCRSDCTAAEQTSTGMPRVSGSRVSRLRMFHPRSSLPITMSRITRSGRISLTYS